MNVLFLVFLFLGALFFLLDALGVASRFNLTAAGLLMWILIPLITLADTFI